MAYPPRTHPPHMKPKYRYPVANKDEIPAELSAYYKESNGFLVLDIEGAADAEKLTEFRNTNTRLTGEIEIIAAAATGKTAAEFRGAKHDAILAEITAAREAAEAAGSAKGKEEIDKAATARIEALKTSHAREIATREERITKQNTELSRLKIDHKILELGTAAGLLPTAADDLAARASRVFSLDEHGQIIARKPDGTALFDDKGEDMTPEKWIESQRTAATHLFKPAEGTGSPGGGGGGAPAKTGLGAGPNPWDPKTTNRTLQGQIYKKDPALAVRMAAQHNVKLQMPAK